MAAMMMTAKMYGSTGTPERVGPPCPLGDYLKKLRIAFFAATRPTRPTTEGPESSFLGTDGLKQNEMIHKPTIHERNVTAVSL
jgi:hypothetical protein